MKAFKHAVSVLAGLCLSGGVMAMGFGDELSSTTLSELALARAATAKYHDVRQAEADGYASIGFCEPGEGCHWINFGLVDGTFDVARPEALLYAPGPGGDGLRLVAVEYVVPLALSLSPGTPPAGFTGEGDVWREDTEGAGLWELTGWPWLNNPNGMFEQFNPRVP